MGQPDRIILEMDRLVQIPGRLCPGARRSNARVPFSARILSDLPERAQVNSRLLNLRGLGISAI